MSSVETTRWWAIVGRDSGYTIDVRAPEEAIRYRREFREERSEVLGEFDSLEEAEECLKNRLTR